MKTLLQVLLCLAPAAIFVFGYGCGMHEERRKVGRWVNRQHRKARGIQRMKGEEGWERDPDWWKESNQ